MMNRKYLSEKRRTTRLRRDDSGVGSDTEKQEQLVSRVQMIVVSTVHNAKTCRYSYQCQKHIYMYTFNYKYINVSCILLYGVCYNELYVHNCLM